MDDDNLPQKIREDAKNVISSLLPKKSGDKYEHAYDQFMQWKANEQVDSHNFSENVLLAYFHTLSDKYKSSSLWSFYSMLKATIQKNNNVDINYPKLNSFLKKNGVGFVPKKSNVFQPEDILKFLSEATDDAFLDVKVILIFRIYGATRADELTKVCVEHVTKQGGILLVKIPDTKTNKPRSFTLENEHRSYVEKYLKLRPSQPGTNRFFLNYRNGKCTKQVIGRSKFLGAPKIIAKFLTLENPEAYTGHSFRRTSATLLADGGADITTLKRHGGWRSDSVAEGYIAESVQNKRKVANLITNQIQSSMTSVVQSQSTVVNILPMLATSVINDVHSGSNSNATAVPTSIINNVGSTSTISTVGPIVPTSVADSGAGAHINSNRYGMHFYNCSVNVYNGY